MSSIRAVRAVVVSTEKGPDVLTPEFDPEKGSSWEGRNPEKEVLINMHSGHWWRASDHDKKHPLDFGQDVDPQLRPGTDEVFIVYDSSDPKQSIAALSAIEGVRRKIHTMRAQALEFEEGEVVVGI